jgi:cation diffusion facilitator family transporter
VGDAKRRGQLIRVLRFSVAAAIVTIALKTGAWAVTGSVGLLSDAAESVVNLVAAIVALGIVHWASRPPDEDHAFGHDKADYFSAGFEGGLIVLAAGTIAVAAVNRLIHPEPVDNIVIGVVVTSIATLINLAMSRWLVRVGKEQESVVLEADGRHLMADVWTSVGVVIGVIAVVITGWERLDPIIALIVAANVLVTGWRLVKRSANGLMDHALDADELHRIDRVLDRFTHEDDVQFHALRTRRSGRRAFVSVHVLVPGKWSVQQGHDLAEAVELELTEELRGLSNIFTHLEPVDDPISHQDVELDRVPRGDQSGL